ncbi:MAG: Hsp20/alpha crystallin family protein [Acidobacteriota bacterium]|jgi:HSP20 family protein
MRQMLTSFVELLQLQAEINRLFEALQTLQDEQAGPDVGFSPPYDVIESEEAIFVEMDLPGVDSRTLKVSVKEALVTVEGERSRLNHPGIRAYHLMERDHGHFSRTFRIDGAVNTHRAEAHFRLGVLTLRFPRVANQRGEVITVPVNFMD